LLATHPPTKLYSELDIASNAAERVQPTTSGHPHWKLRYLQKVESISWSAIHIIITDERKKGPGAYIRLQVGEPSKSPC